MAGHSVKLFLSCVSDEFGGYRDVLRRALTRPNVEVKIQEDFKALGGDTLGCWRNTSSIAKRSCISSARWRARRRPDQRRRPACARPDLEDRLPRSGPRASALRRLLHAVGGVARALFRKDW